MARLGRSQPHRPVLPQPFVVATPVQPVVSQPLIRSRAIDSVKRARSAPQRAFRPSLFVPTPAPTGPVYATQVVRSQALVQAQGRFTQSGTNRSFFSHPTVPPGPDPNIGKAFLAKRVAEKNGKLLFIPMDGFCDDVVIGRPYIAKRVAQNDGVLHYLIGNQKISKNGSQLILCKPYLVQRVAEKNGKLHFLVGGKKGCPVLCCFCDRFALPCIPPVRFVIESPDFATIDTGPLAIQTARSSCNVSGGSLFWGSDAIHFLCQGGRYEFAYNDGAGKVLIFRFYSTSVPNLSVPIVPDSCNPFLFIHSSIIEGEGADYGAFTPLFPEGSLWARSGASIASVDKEGSTYTLTASEA